MKISLFKFVVVMSILILGCQPSDPTTPSPNPDPTFCKEYKQTEILEGEDLWYFPRSGKDKDCTDFNSGPFLNNLRKALKEKIQEDVLDLKVSFPCECDKNIVLIDYSDINKNEEKIGFEERTQAADSGAEDEEKPGRSQNKRFIIDPLNPSPLLERVSDTLPSRTSSPKNFVNVGIVDSGIDLYVNSSTNEGPFSDKFWNTTSENCLDINIAGYDFVAQDPRPIDSVGHGSHVAGIIGSAEINGVADPEKGSVRLLSLKVSTESSIKLSDALCAISFAAQQGCELINLSWGYYAPEPDEALQKIMTDYPDVLFITSAGNDNVNTDKCLHWPSNFSKNLDNVISVGALNQAQDAKADFSNFGDETVNLLAPGTCIDSNIPVNSCGTKDGSSMSAAYVTRLAAIIKLNNPDLKGAALKQEVYRQALPMSGISTTEGKIVNGDRTVLPCTSPPCSSTP